MENVLRFFQQYESAIYFILGLGGLIYGWEFWKAWLEVRGAVFGLEQISAQRKLNRAVITLFILLISGFAVLTLVMFSEDIMTNIALPSPIENSVAEVSPTASAVFDDTSLAPTPLPTVELSTEGCVKGEVEILSPREGTTISGDVTVEGTVNINNFGFFKLEVAEANQALWLTIQAGRLLVIEDILVENWDTSLLPPGSYVLQLVVTESSGEVLPPCRIPITISPSN